MPKCVCLWIIHIIQHIFFFIFYIIQHYFTFICMKIVSSISKAYSDSYWLLYWQKQSIWHLQLHMRTKTHSRHAWCLRDKPFPVKTTIVFSQLHFLRYVAAAAARNALLFLTVSACGLLVSVLRLSQLWHASGALHQGSKQQLVREVRQKWIMISLYDEMLAAVLIILHLKSSFIAVGFIQREQICY